MKRVWEGLEGLWRGAFDPPSPIFSDPRALILTALRTKQGRKVWVQPSPKGSNSHRAGQGRGDLPIPSTLSSSALEFSLHTPSDLDLGEWGKVVMETFPPPWLRPLERLKRFRGPTGQCHHLWGSVPRQTGAAAEAGARSPGGAAAAPPPPPPHTGVRSAAQHSPCRAPASDRGGGFLRSPTDS